MDKKSVLHLLNNVKNQNNVGIASIDAIGYAIENDLIERTELGNFKLSQKGEDFLSDKLKWHNI